MCWRYWGLTAMPPPMIATRSVSSNIVYADKINQFVGKSLCKKTARFSRLIWVGESPNERRVSAHYIEP